MAQYPDPAFEYTVQSGDTHASLARRLGIAEDELRRLTGPLIPGGTVSLPAPGACSRGVFYTLRSGDTLLRVAQRGGSTMRQLLAANPYLNPGRYVPGQVIVVPACGGGTRVYTLQPGERLFDVLRRFRVDISTFCSLNPGQKPMDVRPGQTVLLPAGKPFDI
jgi:LysM repeat protein